jgi:hypothetical protein
MRNTPASPSMPHAPVESPRSLHDTRFLVRPRLLTRP